jgi:hypothetical protein
VDKAFRHIPKIVLTAFPTSYENLRKALGSALDELPPAVAFVNKAEGPQALLEVIGRALEFWPRLRMSTTKVSEQIKADHSVARQQARLNYTGLSLVRANLAGKHKELRVLARFLTHFRWFCEVRKRQAKVLLYSNVCRLVAWIPCHLCGYLPSVV